VRALGQRRSAARLPVWRAACTGGFFTGRCGAERFAGKSAPGKKAKPKTGGLKNEEKETFRVRSYQNVVAVLTFAPGRLVHRCRQHFEDIFFLFSFFLSIFCESLFSSFEMCADWNGSDHHGHHHHVHHHRSMSGNAAMLHAMR
jgi:hypothetical protein